MNDLPLLQKNENPGVSKDQIENAIAEMRNYFPDDENLKMISIDELIEKVHEFIHSDQTITIKLPDEVPAVTLRDDLIDSCHIAIAEIVIDSVLLILGFFGLHLSSPNKLIEAIPKAAKKIAVIIAKDPKKWLQLLINIVSSIGPKKAVAIYALIKEAFKAGMFNAIFDSIKECMKPIDYVITITATVAQIGALVLTDGAAFIAVLALNSAAIAHLVEAIINVIDKCKK